MAFKDERGHNDGEAAAQAHGLKQRKAIGLASAQLALGPWTLLEPRLTPALTEGPALFWRDDVEFGAGWTLFFDFFMEERFGALHSSDARQWHDITSRARFPPGPRHAGVLELAPEKWNNACVIEALRARAEIGD